MSPLSSINWLSTLTGTQALLDPRIHEVALNFADGGVNHGIGPWHVIEAGAARVRRHRGATQFLPFAWNTALPTRNLIAQCGGSRKSQVFVQRNPKVGYRRLAEARVCNRELPVLPEGVGKLRRSICA
jgi:hypothetical protein